MSSGKFVFFGADGIVAGAEIVGNGWSTQAKWRVMRSGFLRNRSRYVAAHNIFDTHEQALAAWERWRVQRAASLRKQLDRLDKAKPKIITSLPIFTPTTNQE